MVRVVKKKKSDNTNEQLTKKTPVGASRQSDSVVGSPGGFGFTHVCKRFREGRLDTADCSLFSTRLPVSIMMPK